MSNGFVIHREGPDADEAKYGMVMLHGRGSDVNDMKSVLPNLQLEKVHIVILQAPIEIMPGRFAWYRYFWNENLEQNLKDLKNSFNILEHCIADLEQYGIEQKDTMLFGHSQGANLVLEFFSQKNFPLKAVIALRGCFLGEYSIDRNFDTESLPDNTKVIMHAGRNDPYIPFKKVEQTAQKLENRGADVTTKQYKTGHGICRDELIEIRQFLKNEL